MQHPVHRRARRRRLPRARARSATPGTKLVCFNERFARPGIYEVPFGMTMRELCEDVAGGMRDGRAIKALQIGGPLGGILPALAARHARSTSTPLAAEGCMVGHGGIVAFDDAHRHARRRHAPAALRRRTRAAASASRAGSACAARTRCSPTAQPVDRATLEELLETLELGSLCAHGGGMPAPIRSLLAHFPEELGLRVIDASRSTARRSTVAAGDDGARGRARGRQPIPTLCFDERQAPFGACRVCLVGVEGAPGPLARLHDAVPRRDGGRHAATRPPRRVAGAVVELVLSELPEPPGRAHRARRRSRASSTSASRAGPARDHELAHDERHPTSPSSTSCASRCGRCVRACDEVQGTFALTATGRGFDANIAAGLDEGFRESACVSCGACADTCPTDAITEITAASDLTR